MNAGVAGPRAPAMGVVAGVPVTPGIHSGLHSNCAPPANITKGPG